MPKIVCHGAQLQCDQGVAPSSLTVLRPPMTAGDVAMATVDDYVPNLNIAPFGMCQTQGNPQVAAATAAAQGVLTPMPCVPVTTAAWSPGSSITTIDGVKALTDDSKCSCQWTGSISIKSAGGEVETE